MTDLQSLENVQKQREVPQILCFEFRAWLSSWDVGRFGWDFFGLWEERGDGDGRVSHSRQVWQGYMPKRGLRFTQVRSARMRAEPNLGDHLALFIHCWRQRSVTQFQALASRERCCLQVGPVRTQVSWCADRAACSSQPGRDHPGFSEVSELPTRWKSMILRSDQLLFPLPCQWVLPFKKGLLRVRSKGRAALAGLFLLKVWLFHVSAG